MGPSYGHGTDPVADHDFFRALRGDHTTIFANVPHVMAYSQLHNIILGLLLFATGADKEEGDERHRVLSFGADDVCANK